jgi:hypothetical protein
MKQALLIAAHKDFDHLLDIFTHFSGGNFEFYVHINKKSIVEPDIMQKIRANGNVKFISNKYSIRWGGLNLLKTIHLLAEEALKNREITFFHFISGQDMPVKESSYFENTLDRNKDYLEYFKLPAECWKYGGMDRLELYNLYDVINGEKYLGLIRFLHSLQLRMNFKRPIGKNIPGLYGGSTWWSLTRETLQYVIDYTRNDTTLINRMKYSFGADEMYFQTVVMNSACSENVINDSLRYVWFTESGHSGVLDKSHFPSIKSSNKLFARKFDSAASKELKSMLARSFAASSQQSL